MDEPRKLKLPILKIWRRLKYGKKKDEKEEEKKEQKDQSKNT